MIMLDVLIGFGWFAIQSKSYMEKFVQGQQKIFDMAFLSEEEGQQEEGQEAVLHEGLAKQLQDLGG